MQYSQVRTRSTGKTIKFQDSTQNCYSVKLVSTVQHYSFYYVHDIELCPYWFGSFCILSQTYNATVFYFDNTGHSRYVDFAYLDTTTYVEVNFHSQHFFSIFLCISTPFMSKTVNMTQRVSRGNFSCLRRIFYYICYCLC